MSEKTLEELFADLRKQALYTVENYRLVAILEARIRRAEAAEQFADFAAIHHETGATEDVYEAAERLLSEYKAAREAVCKMEAGLSNDDNS